MAQSHAFLLLLLGLYLMASASATTNSAVDAVVGSPSCNDEMGDCIGSPSCNEEMGDCISEDTKMDMESKANRRALRRHVRYISYGALYRDKVPCSRRGTSYYNCTKFKKVNPYRRGCSHITGCARYLY